MPARGRGAKRRPQEQREQPRHTRRPRRLAFSHARKRVGAVEALADCSFSLARGRMLGFLGPNGAGKTTAMRAVFGLVALDGGDLIWDGRPIDGDRRLRFGYMPEERGLYPRMPVGDQLAYLGCLHGLSARAARAATAEWLDRLGMAERAGATLEELSHGNQQRAPAGGLAPARAGAARARRAVRGARSPRG
jgi:ABC-2 type transport system ATP-binding protein